MDRALLLSIIASSPPTNIDYARINHNLGGLSLTKNAITKRLAKLKAQSAAASDAYHHDGTRTDNQISTDAGDDDEKKNGDGDTWATSTARAGSRAPGGTNVKARSKSTSCSPRKRATAIIRPSPCKDDDAKNKNKNEARPGGLVAGELAGELKAHGAGTQTPDSKANPARSDGRDGAGDKFSPRKKRPRVLSSSESDESDNDGGSE